MKTFLERLKNNWRKILALVAIVLFVIIIALAILDINDIPSHNGISFVQFDWANTLMSMSVGLLTLYFTLSVAENQKKMETDKIASEKFFKVHFVKKYQRIELENGTNIKLKIQEPANDTLKNFRLYDDIKVFPIRGCKQIDEEGFDIEVEHDECIMEHTDDGMDKDWPDNKLDFCFVRVNIKNDSKLDSFCENGTYKVELPIIVTDIFGVEVKCKLCPWFTVVEKGNKRISFSVEHNFGYYDYVKYIGSK